MTSGSIAACLALGMLGCSRGNTASHEVSAIASSSAPVASASAGDAAAGKAFGAPCVEDAECAGGACFHKRRKGPDAGAERRGGGEAVEHDGYCSFRCSEDSECLVPPTKGKCGARGMCKRPE